MTGKNSTNKPLKRFCFTGVRGVGKSTIIDRIKSNVPEVHFVSGSGILQEMMGDDYIFFEYLPEKEKYSLRIKLNELLRNTQLLVARDLVVDSHLTVYNLKTDFIDTIFTEQDIEFYTDIILLDSCPEKIYNHRSKDTSKKRILDMGNIARELETEREEAKRVASEYGLGLYIIEMDNSADEEMKKLLCSDRE